MLKEDYGLESRPSRYFILVQFPQLTRCDSHCFLCRNESTYQSGAQDLSYFEKGHHSLIGRKMADANTLWIGRTFWSISDLEPNSANQCFVTWEFLHPQCMQWCRSPHAMRFCARFSREPLRHMVMYILSHTAQSKRDVLPVQEANPERASVLDCLYRSFRSMSRH